jgi:hypothetical protein
MIEIKSREMARKASIYCQDHWFVCQQLSLFYINIFVIKRNKLRIRPFLIFKSLKSDILWWQKRFEKNLLWFISNSQLVFWLLIVCYFLNFVMANLYQTISNTWQFVLVKLTVFKH